MTQLRPLGLLLLTLTVLCLWSSATWACGGCHPPGSAKKKLPPSKASADLKAAEKMLKNARKIGDKEGEAKARELLNRAKRTLVEEGRYACCIGDGGCDECAFEQECPCGIELNEGKSGQGVCRECYDGWKAGKGLFTGIEMSEVRLNPYRPSDFYGMYGDWGMTREGSGTSWLPDSSPMYAVQTRWGDFNTMTMGYGYGVYTDQGGPRGDSDFYASTRLMGMAWRRVGPEGAGGGIVGGRLMVSADPAVIGSGGYPLLFAGMGMHDGAGRDMRDRQHPHDGLMELAVSYSHRLTAGGTFATLYLAAVGEPAYGPGVYVHRISAYDNPEAPISDPWFGANHVTPGVATLAFAGYNLKVEGSIFTGRENDDRRWQVDPLRWDSYSGRVSYNPTPNLALQVSYADVKSPDAMEPGTSKQRATASAIYNLPVTRYDANWQTTFAWGRNRPYGRSDTLTRDALLLETAYLARDWTGFGRVETVQRDDLMETEMPGMDEEELPGMGMTMVEAMTRSRLRVTKYTLGGVRNLTRFRGAELGIGGSVSLFSVPGVLRPVYGSSPTSFTLFVRLRSTRM